MSKAQEQTKVEEEVIEDLPIIEVGNIEGESTNSYNWAKKNGKSHRHTRSKITRINKEIKGHNIQEGLFRAQNKQLQKLYTFDETLLPLLEATKRPDTYAREGYIRCISCGISYEANSDNFQGSKNRRYDLSTICKECKNKKGKKHYINTKTEQKERGAVYYKNNRNSILKKQKKNNSKPENKKRLKEYAKKYKVNNKDKISIYNKKRREQDKLFHLRSAISSNLLGNLKKARIPKTISTFKYIGCTPTELKDHLNKGMYTMEEYSKNKKGSIEFHIDHIIPSKYYVDRILFDKDGNVTKETEPWLYKWWNWRNFRIWPAGLNCSKGDDMDYDLIKKHRIEDLLVI